MADVTILLSALLFGGMVLYSFGFAAFVFTNLPADLAGPLIRKAFPHFYLFVLGCALLAGISAVFVDRVSTMLLAFIAVTTIYARQVLMPAINAATDAGNAARFKRLHGMSVGITLVHIGIAAWVVLRLS
ncbi:MAG: DUF4149 domain-containing protein [Pseudomonadota bacterium]